MKIVSSMKSALNEKRNYRNIKKSQIMKKMVIIDQAICFWPNHSSIF